MDVKVFAKGKAYYENFDSIFRKNKDPEVVKEPCIFCGNTSDLLTYKEKTMCFLCAHGIARLCVKLVHSKFEEENKDGK